MFIFEFFLLMAGFFLLVNFILTRLGKGFGTQKRLSGERDALRETQELSAREAADSGLSPAQQEYYQDTMSISVCFARFALQVSYADGYLSPNEVESIFAFFRGAQPRVQQHIQEVLQQDLNDQQNIDWDYNTSEARRILAKPAWKDFSSIIFEGLLSISIADGVLSRGELEVVFSIMAQLGWSRQRCESWFHARMSGYGYQGRSGYDSGESFSQDRSWQGGQTSRPDTATRVKEAADVLGVSPEANPEQIKKRYRELVRENHPDRFAAMGEEMQKTATRRFQIIQQAYEFLMQHKGAK